MPDLRIEKFDERRIRDPVHGLIVFDGKDDADRFAWALMQTPEFQRLRRIKQLGFSEFVYPGASHTRFAHSVGAFHVAKRLLRVVERHLGRRRKERRNIAARLAVLLHDIGHGPFSHAFEHVTKAIGQLRGHEEWSVEIVTGDTETRRILEALDPSMPEEIATMISGEEAPDVYATVVSSQFDADRLDYLQRDRVMSGVQTGHIDRDWLFDCLRIGRVTIGGNDQPEACMFVNHKGLRVAEEYLEARFRLYAGVYMHKTTRAAEKMLEEAMRQLDNLTRAGRRSRGAGPLQRFLRSRRPSLGDYLALDDTTVWRELSLQRDSRDRRLAELSGRLLDRRLFKCLDLGPLLDRAGAHEQLARFRSRVKERCPNVHVIEDDATVTAYKWYDADDPRALKKVFVQRHRDDKIPVDIAAPGVSKVVETLLSTEERIHRFYVPSEEDRTKLRELWKGIGR